MVGSRVIETKDMKSVLTSEFNSSSRVDIMVGYANNFGFDFISPLVERVDKVRIIVGMQSDKDLAEIVDGVVDGVVNRSGRASRFISLLGSGKVELRFAADGKLHAKAYIFTKKDGRVNAIVGSSNLTHSGLCTNREISVIGEGDSEKLLDIFEREWDMAVASDSLVSGSENLLKSSGESFVELTQYELFIRVLQDVYRGSVSDVVVMPDGLKVLRYQEDAVIQLLNTVNRHRGCFLADVVGLGKTYVSALSMLKIPANEEILVTCPAGVVESWRGILDSFGLRNVSLVSHQNLNRFTDRYGSSYKASKLFNYIYVDEAHKFRNADTSWYKRLKALCQYDKGVKVILITATPLNNDPRELRNMLGLFQNLHTSNTLIEDKSLSRYLYKFIKSINKVRQSGDKVKITNEIMSCSKHIRMDILHKITIRRTRKDILTYYSEDMSSNGWVFPVVEKPVSVSYDFLKMPEKMLLRTQESMGKLKFARYRLNDYLWEREFSDSHKFLDNIIRINLMKRMDSSVHSFILSIDNMITKYKQTVEDFNNGFVRKTIRYEEIDEEVLGSDRICVQKGLKNPALFIQHIKEDLEVLKEFKDNWESFKDVKLQELFRLLDTLKGQRGKILIFSQYRTTVEYLEAELKARNYRALGYSSKVKHLRGLVDSDFDANYEFGSDDYDILVTTDTLSEGVNLHRANIIINYDIPWNPTVVIQRVGRVNRLGTKFSNIFIYNFFPLEGTDRVIKSEKNILSKLRVAFHFFGDDSDVLTGDSDLDDIETIESQIHDMVKVMNEETTELFADSDAYYMTLLNSLKSKNADFYNWLASLSGDLCASKNSDLVYGDRLLYVSEDSGYTFYEVSGRKVGVVSQEYALGILKCDASVVQESKADNVGFKEAKAVVLGEYVKETVFISQRGNFDAGGRITRFLKDLYNSSCCLDTKKDVRVIKWGVRNGKYSISEDTEAQILELIDEGDSFEEIKKLFDECEDVERKTSDKINLICSLV